MKEELFKRLDNHEDNFIERKLEGIKSRDIRKTAVAFANSVPENKTAVLFIGVSDDGGIVGVNNTDSMQKHITEVLKDCYPTFSYHLEVLEKEGKHIIAVEIFHSKDRPHFSGPAYIRDGSKSVTATKEKFEELIATRLSKVYEIQKWKDKPISVVALRKKLGSTENLADSKYREFHECRIEECAAHTIKLYDMSKGMWFVEPLENITLSKDTKNLDRLMLIVQEK